MERRRDPQFIVTLICSRCGLIGYAMYERNESPSGRKLLSVDGGFQQGHGDDPELYCDCGEKVALSPGTPQNGPVSH
jgi:hypothetical protein